MRPMIATAVVVTFLVLSFATYQFFLPADRRPIVSSATSPDGSWSVVVLASALENRRYEMIVEVRDAAGRRVGESFSVGSAARVSDARQGDSFAVSYVDNTVAKIGGRTIKKAEFFP